MLISGEKDNIIQLILKLSGNACNINCVYCYEKQRKYSESKYLTVDTLRKTLSKFKNQTIHVQLHGGEPLIIGQTRMKEIVDELHRHEEICSINIQTNATLLTEEWLEFFDRNCPELELGISIDGDIECNSFRVNYQNESTFHLVDNALRLCEMRGKNIGVISVVNRNSINREEYILDYFSQFKCIKMINFMPCIQFDDTNFNQNLNQWATSNYEYYEFIRNIFDIWKEKSYYQKFIIDPIFSIIRRLYGKSSTLCHFNENKCSHIYTLYPDGILGSCDELSISRNISDENQSSKDDIILQRMNQLISNCVKCSYYTICTGGCIGARARCKDIKDLNQYCRSRANLIDYISSKINIQPIVAEIPDQEYIW